MFMQRLPGGMCFSHGPYKDGYECPEWPKCVASPQQKHWIDLALAQRKKRALIDAAGILEKNDLLADVVVALRQKADEYAG